MRVTLLFAVIVVMFAAPGLPQDNAEPPLGIEAEPGMYAHLTRWRNGVQPLTKATLPIALRANQFPGGYAPEQDPFRLRIALLTSKQFPVGALPKDADTVFKIEQAQKSLPYQVRILTPFVRVAHLSAIAKTRYEDVAFDIAAENKTGVSILVMPNTALSDRIERVLIKRGTVIHRSQSGGTVPLSFRTLMTELRQDGGLFYFPLSVFSIKDASDLTLVFIGASGTIEQTMTHRELEAMR